MMSRDSFDALRSLRARKSRAPSTPADRAATTSDRNISPARRDASSAGGDGSPSAPDGSPSPAPRNL